MILKLYLIEHLKPTQYFHALQGGDSLQTLNTLYHSHNASFEGDDDDKEQIEENDDDGVALLVEKECRKK